MIKGKQLGSGLGFLPGVLIDQHFEQRGRLRRLLAAIAQHPHELGVGIDEDTAVVVHNHTFEVFGSGSVTVIDAGGLTHTNLGEVERHELLAVRPRVAVEALRQLGVLGEGEVRSLSEFARQTLYNHRGAEVGEARAAFRLPV